MNQQQIKDIFEYHEGKLLWKVRKACNTKIGREAGSTDYQGYKIVRVNKKQHKIHRLIFCMFYGYLPKKVDHIDGNPANNLIANLRAASDSENQYNRKTNSNNKFGIKGVSYWNGKYRVQLQANKKKMHIGVFEDLELAELVAIEARDKYHRGFAK